MAVRSLLRRIPAGALYVSEPEPCMFGNPENTPTKPGWTNANWLKSRFHMSFAEYGNPRNSSFGVMRVMNDDLVQPARGFGTHPHRDMEICTYIVHGQLTHKDSMGTAETLGRGAVQYMSAGSGVRHSEFNLAADKTLRFIQIWILPRRSGMTPQYGGCAGSPDARNAFVHLVGDVERKPAAGDAPYPVAINQDANLHVAQIEAGQSAAFEVGPGRQAYVLQMEGATTVTDASGAVATTQLAAYDGAEAIGPAALVFTAAADKPAHVLILEMAYSERSHGRTDL